MRKGFFFQEVKCFLIHCSSFFQSVTSTNVKLGSNQNSFFLFTHYQVNIWQNKHLFEIELLPWMTDDGVSLPTFKDRLAADTRSFPFSLWSCFFRCLATFCHLVKARNPLFLFYIIKSFHLNISHILPLVCIVVFIQSVCFLPPPLNPSLHQSLSIFLSLGQCFLQSFLLRP